MKNFLIIIWLVFCISVASAQDSTYFNKLIFPQQGTNTVNTIIKTDSFYFLSAIYLDTPFYYTNTQGFQIIKLDLLGNLIDHKVWIDSTRNITYGNFYNNCLLVSKKGNLYACGGSYDSSNVANGILFCIKPNLDTIWTKTFTHPDTLAASQPGANIFNTLTAIRETYDGGFIISGNYYKNCNPNIDRSYLMKVDSSGNLQWIEKYNDVQNIFDIELAVDSGFYFPAYVNNDMRAVKTNKYGIIEWSVNVNSNIYTHLPIDLELSNTNYIYISSAYVYDATYIKSGITLCKIDISNQSKLWEKNYILFNNFKSQSLHQSMGLDILPSGNLVISGTSKLLVSGPDPHKGVLMKLTANGDSLWARKYGYGIFTDDCQFNDIVLTDDGGFLAVGWQWHNNGGLFYQNAWLVKMDSMGCDTAGCDIYDAISQPQIRPQINMKLYPNPTSDYFRISADGVEQLHNLWLRITDMQGREIQRIELKNYLSNTSIDVSNLQVGIYSVSLYSRGVLLEVKQLNIVR